MKTLKELNSKWYWRIIKITFVISALLIVSYQLSTLFDDFSERKISISNINKSNPDRRNIYNKLVKGIVDPKEIDTTKNFFKELQNDTQDDTDKLIFTEGRKLSEEDEKQLLDDKAKGIPESESIGNMIAKKRYQFGTRKFAPQTITESNIGSVFDKSELAEYIRSKVTPTMNEYITKALEEGKSKEVVIHELAFFFLQQDLAEDLNETQSTDKKNLINGGKIIIGSGVELVAAVPHFFGFIINLASLDPIEQNSVGKFINNGTNEIANKIKRGAGIDTGEITGNIDNSFLVKDILDFLLPFLLLIFIIRSISYYIIFGKVFPPK